MKFFPSRREQKETAIEHPKGEGRDPMTEHPATGDWLPSTEKVPADLPIIPGYEVLAELGRGGMGIVYKARQLSLKRLVALKLIRDGALAGPQERARFQIEAEAAARMQHPNIVQIYAVGEHEGRPYFAMELVEGGNLDQHLAGRSQPAAAAAAFVRTLALAVHHAHAQHVVHRDLKPANILLSSLTTEYTEDTEKKPRSGSLPSVSSVPSVVNLNPKITDFGLAKRLDSESTAWTQAGAVLGTASYMAPEQAAGRVHEIGPAADVYALGAILYELLTGKPPFRAETLHQTVQQVLHDEPTPPGQLCPGVPRDLDTICLKCLEKEAGRRYAGAGELANDLGRFLEGQPVAAVPLSESERLARLARRDGYVVMGEVGRGPRSTVYQARSDQLQQPVALKVFTAGICAREEWEARQQRGADLWATLAHPHIVPVQRTGWWDGAPYLATEYVAHGSLAARLGSRPYSLSAALRLAEQLTEIVCYLHRQGVVHGNLKPSNVLLAANGIPRVVDFRLTGGLFQGPLLAHDAEPACLGYLPPESTLEPGAEPRPYTDIYGLGVILYELLTGRPPFAGASAHETLEQVRADDPVPPSRFNAEVTPALEAVCLRCLRKNPWRRYWRAYDLLTRLRAFQDELGSRLEPGEPRPKRRPRSNPS
jgi:serine/threonine protein kinase